MAGRKNFADLRTFPVGSASKKVYNHIMPEYAITE